MVKLRDVRDQAVSSLHTRAEKNALIVKNASEEKALAISRGDTLSEAMRHRDEQLDQSLAQVDRLEAEIWRRNVNKEQADSSEPESTKQCARRSVSPSVQPVEAGPKDRFSCPGYANTVVVTLHLPNQHRRSSVPTSPPSNCAAVFSYSK